MRTAFVTLCCLGSTVYAEAQSTFEKYYLPINPSYQVSLVELAGHDLFAGVEGSGGTVIDADGNSLQTVYLIHDSVFGIQAARKSADGKFYFASIYHGDHCGDPYNPALRHWHPALGRMDSAGHVLGMRKYVLNDGCLNGVSDLNVLHDNSLITWGREASFFILKADSSLSHVWSRHFANHGGFQFIKELPGGDLLAGMNMDTAGAAVARFDPSGNFLWCK